MFVNVHAYVCRWAYGLGGFGPCVVGQGRPGLRKLPIVSGAIGPKPVLIKGSGLDWRRRGSPECSTATG